MAKKIVIVLASLQLVIAACNRDYAEDLNEPEIQQWNSCELDLKISPESRDAGVVPTTFMNEDAIVIRFIQPDKSSVIGYAKYNTHTNSWTARYKGILTSCDNGICEVAYIGNHPDLNDDVTKIPLTPENPIYLSATGQYAYDGNKIFMHTVLKGGMARIKFKGNSASEFEIKGLAYYKSFNLNTWTVTVSEPYSEAIKVTLKSGDMDTYESPYLYLSIPIGFNDSRIWVKEGDNIFVYNRTLENLVKPAASGIVHVPSVDAHDGWSMDIYKKQTFPNVALKSTSMATDGESPTLEPFYSKTGVYLTFDNILSTGWYDGFLDEEFYFDFDSDGGYWSWVVWIENGMGHIFDDDNLVKNEKYHYSGLIYNPEASYYSLRFVTYRLTYNVSNITMSNF